MYKVFNSDHDQYKKVVVIEQAEDGDIETPFFAWQRALTQRRLWREQGAKNIRFLVVGQIMAGSQLEAWSIEEYKNLPKCAECGKILGGDVYTHQLCNNNLFCTPNCADQSYHKQVEEMKDEQDIDFR